MTSGTKHRRTIEWGMLALAFVLLLSPAAAQAGTILLPGELKDDAFVPKSAEEAATYSIRYSTITAAVDGQMAETEIQETIVGPDQAVDTVCLIPLPEGVKAQSVSVVTGARGAAPAKLDSARFLDADMAQQVYEKIAQGVERVEILALTGKPAMLVPRFRLEGKVNITVTYRQAINDLNGVHSLQCPTPATRWADGPVARLSVAVTVRDRQPIRAVFSPTHDAAVEREGLSEATARVKADNWSGEDDFRLCWVCDRDELGLRALAYRDPASSDGYFMLVGNPTGSAEGDRAIAKDVVFVLDTSGSMRGEKIEQARAAIEYCLGQLNEGDRFNIVTFGTEVRSFRDALVERSADQQAAAQEFIEDVIAQGRTNISGALKKALAGKAPAGRPYIAIFLTDGTPTAGELVPDKIVESVTADGACPARIFVMGVGHDVNTHLLDKLAEATNGSSAYVTMDEEIDAKVAALYDRLSHPVLTNVLVDCGDLRTHSIYPKKLPARFIKGSEFMLFGRYRDGGSQTFTLSGSLAGQPARYTCEIDLPDQPTGDSTDFVAPLWAAHKIGYLLQEIRLHGENEELIAEVVRLSKKFGIVTEYTEFLATSDSELSTELAVGEATRRLNMANAVQAGQWAFNQARNDLNLQKKQVVGKAANFYLDRQGRRVATERIEQFGDNVFYLRDGQWVDAQDTGERQARTVKLFSDEYNELVRHNRRFAQAQRLGWAMSINVGDERIVVEKDGSTQSEELLEKTRQQMPGGQQAPLQQFQQLRNNGFNNLQLQNQVPMRQQRINQAMPLNQLQDLQINQVPNQRVQQPQAGEGNRQPNQRQAPEDDER